MYPKKGWLSYFLALFDRGGGEVFLELEKIFLQGSPLGSSESDDTGKIRGMKEEGWSLT